MPSRMKRGVLCAAAPPNPIGPSSVGFRRGDGSEVLSKRGIMTEVRVARVKYLGVPANSTSHHVMNECELPPFSSRTPNS